MKMIRNERGILTVDFMFSIVLILGLASLMFVLTFTLTMAEVTQYITFAAARNYTTAHITKAQQEERAVAKYKELVDNPVFKPMYKNGWFKVDEEPTVGDHAKLIEGYQTAASVANQFWGVGTNFYAPVLAFKIPFFGTTVPDGDEDGMGFKTYLGSYLGREPTTEECLAFTAARWNAIRNMQTSGGAAYSTAGANGYFPQTDDGC